MIRLKPIIPVERYSSFNTLVIIEQSLGCEVECLNINPHAIWHAIQPTMNGDAVRNKKITFLTPNKDVKRYF